MNPLMEKGSVPMLIVLSGPSGVGKDAVLSRMKGQDRPYYYAVTATTRAQRKNEINGKDYIFISENEFRDMIGEDELLEWAEVYGNLYGVPKTQVSFDTRIRCSCEDGCTGSVDNKGVNA